MTTSSQDTLRVGVIGLGFAGHTHLKSYLQVPGVEVVGLAGLETERLHQLGTEHKIPYLHEHWEDLLAHEDIDVISVGTPTFLHAPITIAALESGRHVLSEKPIAENAAAGVAMVQAAHRAGRVLQVAFNHRRRGDVATLHRYVEAGALGDIYHAKASWLRRNGIPGAGSWFTNLKMAGGGPLIDLGVHMLDMALYLLGEPKVLAVSAATYSELGPQGRGASPYSAKQVVGSAYEVEDLGTAFLRLSGGATLLLEASWATYRESGDLYGVTLFGNDGGAEIRSKNYGWEDTLRIYRDENGVPVETRPEVPRGEGHLAVVRSFVEAIQSGDWKGHDGAEGLVRARVIEACYASAREGREVPVDNSPVD
ncbi:MAG: Gfo/Idh/MocA family protein [Mycobacteriales bacterium]